MIDRCDRVLDRQRLVAAPGASIMAIRLMDRASLNPLGKYSLPRSTVKLVKEHFLAVSTSKDPAKLTFRPDRLQQRRSVAAISENRS